MAVASKEGDERGAGRFATKLQVSGGVDAQVAAQVAVRLPSVALQAGAAMRGERLWRSLELLLAITALALALPLLAVAALAIRLDSGGPVIYRQRRLGRALVPFTVHKLRTMVDGAGHERHRRNVLRQIAGERLPAAGSGPRFKPSDDERITRVGRILRCTSIDELPQLLDVICGRMSLVGPRPAIAYEVDHYRPEWFERFAVRPGLTGLWQVSGRGEVTLPEMFALDLAYVRQRSLALNLRILLRTVPVVLSMRGAS
ncbi:MAG TPA: sugar transferase [Solirubrobacteraceae bacterium]|nr:sugar transferase [Solirubrobacteraceae bacterium]